MNPALSPVIFSQLMNGVLINAHELDNGSLVNNRLFDEIFSNLEAYQAQYALLGYELVMIGGCYFIREQGEIDHFRDVSMRIQVLLEVISRQVTEIPLHATTLLEHGSGVPRNALLDMGGKEEVAEILRACDMKNTLIQEVDNILVGRQIAYWNHRDSLVLTDGGKELFDRLYSGDSLAP